MKPRRMLPFATKSCLLAAALHLPGLASAQTWTSSTSVSGSSPNWTTGASWVGGIAPTSSNTTDIIFWDSATSRKFPYIGESITIRSFTLNDNVTSNGYVNLSNGSAGAVNAKDLTFDTDSGSATIGVTSGATGDFTIGGGNGEGTIILNDNLIITNSGSGTLTIARPITGSKAVTIAGTGTTVFSGVNTFTNGVTMSGGVLSVATIGAAGSPGNLGAASNGDGRIVFDGGTLQYTGDTSSTSRRFSITAGKTATIDVTEASTNLQFILGGNGIVSSATTGGLTKIGAGTLTINGNSTGSQYTGATTISAGTLSVGIITNGGVAGDLGKATSAASNLVFDGGTLQYTGGTTSTDRNFTISSGKTASFDVDNSSTNLTLSGTNAATNGGLTKTGSGTLTLSSTNTYTGDTTVSAGKLVVSGSIGASAVTVSNSGTILASGATGTIGNAVTIENGAILAAGDAGSAGTATALGTTTFNNGSIFSWDISSDGTNYDKLLAPSLSGGGAIFRIVAADSSFGDPFWTSGVKTWTDIFTTDGSAAISNWANLFSVSVVDSGFTPITPVSGSFSISGNTLTWTAVPEPTSALAGLLLGAGLLRRRRA